MNMSLILRNLQSAVSIRRATLRRDVEILRRIMGVQKFDLGVICVDNHRIQQINNKYRKINLPTDVLSFSFYEDIQRGKIPVDLAEDDFNLGDIFLGVEYIMKQCEESSEDLHSALTVIVTHGICHLLGFKHETEEEWKEMFQQENYVLNEYNRLTGSRLEPLTKR